MTQSSGEVIALVVTFATLSTVAVALRVWARILSKQSLGIDDYLAFAALVLMIGLLAIPLAIGAAHGHLGEPQKFTPDGVPKLNYVYRMSLFLLEVCSPVTLALAKASLLFFYKRIFIGTLFKFAFWTLLALVIAWGIVSFVASLIECTPINAYLTQGSLSPHVNCIDHIQAFYFSGGFDVATDILILIFPIPLVLRLEMAPKTKIAVLAMFGLGALEVAASITRLAMFIHASRQILAGNVNFTSVTTPTAYWTMLETCLAIIAVCFPTLQPITRSLTLRTLVRKVRSALKSISPRSRSDDRDVGLDLGEVSAGSRQRNPTVSDISLVERDGDPFKDSGSSAASKAADGEASEQKPRVSVLCTKMRKHDQREASRGHDLE